MTAVADVVSGAAKQNGKVIAIILKQSISVTGIVFDIDCMGPVSTRLPTNNMTICVAQHCSFGIMHTHMPSIIDINVTKENYSH